MTDAKQNNQLNQGIIFTVSILSVLVLDRPTPEPHNKDLVSAIQSATNTLKHPVMIDWIPRYIGIQSNEKADAMDKMDLMVRI